MSDFYTWRHAVVRSNLSATTKLVLHTLGCHMNDVGESCFPSIELLCKESSLSKRAVISHLDIAEKAGFLQKAKHGFGGQRWARNEYKATFPVEENQLNSVDNSDVSVDNEKKVVHQMHHVMQEGGAPRAPKVVHQVHPNYTVNYSLLNYTVSPQKNLSTKIANDLANKLFEHGVEVKNAGMVLAEWVDLNIEFDFILSCINLARKKKPPPEKIPANYLHKIIESELYKRDAWFFTEDGTNSKGKEIGVFRGVDETWFEYRDRLRKYLVVNVACF